MTNTIKQHSKTLCLSGLLSSLELRLQEAEANRLPYAEFLELLLQDEINIRHQRLLAPTIVSLNDSWIRRSTVLSPVRQGTTTQTLAPRNRNHSLPDD
jgi:hypothetical protein